MSCMRTENLSGTKGVPNIVLRGMAFVTPIPVDAKT